jgi:hypothetical protein
LTQSDSKDQLENLRRYEALRREQLGAAISLILGLSAAAVGFCISRVVDKDARFSGPGTTCFLIAIGLFIVAVGLGIGATFTRLCDFRLTARKIRRKLRRASAAELSKLKKCTDALGAWTWCLFTAQSSVFCGGIVLLAISLWMLHRDHLYPTAQRTGATAQQAGTNFVIIGRYSVDEATHKQQMADCRDKIAKSRAGINSRTIKPGETLLFDSYDVASLSAHICAEWAAEPLDGDSHEVISEASDLDNLIMAHERVRLEDVNAQLAYYRKQSQPSK